MSDPPRLLEQGGTSPTALEMLRAIDAPQAAPPALHASLAKDLSGLVAGSAVKAAATAAWLKPLLVGVFVLGGGGAMYVATSTPPPAAMAPAKAPAAAVAAAPAPGLAPPVNAEPAAAEPAPAASAAHPKGPASAEPRDKLAEEEALLEAARQAMASDPARALSLLQKHRSQFPKGQLGAERMYLSVDCLQRLGNAAAAKREVEALAKYYPNSAYARRAPLLLRTH